MKPALESRARLRIDRDQNEHHEQDLVAVEEPLELRIAGETWAVTMRTPGHDRELAAGLLLAEGLIEGLADLGGLAHCGRIGEPGYGNVLEATAAPGTAFDPDRMVRRGTLMSAACGVCGRQTIDDLLASCPQLSRKEPLELSVLAHSASALEGNQPGFLRSGGMHAAAVLDHAGHTLHVREDVGRHNAVDKVVGALLLAGQLEADALARGAVLVVSGRVSFEIVQKAARARLPAVCGVSAPTSLAIDLANEVGVTLAAFVRDGTLNLYSHQERVRRPPSG